MFGTKKKLTVAALMLVVSVLMMSTASYAWFTISTNPEITNLKTTVVTNDYLEIALAKGAYNVDTGAVTYSAPGTGATTNMYTWGNLIDMNATGEAGSQPQTAYAALNTILRPIKLSANVFHFPQYGTDGRYSTLGGALTDAAAHTADVYNGFGNLIHTADTTVTPYGYYVDFWVRTNYSAGTGGYLVLSGATDRSTDTAAAAGLGSFFQCTDATALYGQELADNMRIAFRDITDSGSLGNPIQAVTSTAVKTGNDYKSLFSYPKIAGAEASSDTMQTIVALTANDAKLIRMYVYIDGDNITNAISKATGSLNVQFKLVKGDSYVAATGILTGNISDVALTSMDDISYS